MGHKQFIDVRVREVADPITCYVRVTFDDGAVIAVNELAPPFGSTGAPLLPDDPIYVQAVATCEARFDYRKGVGFWVPSFADIEAMLKEHE